jgi:hypothetical protein
MPRRGRRADAGTYDAANDCARQNADTRRRANTGAASGTDRAAGHRALAPRVAAGSCAEKNRNHYD